MAMIEPISWDLNVVKVQPFPYPNKKQLWILSLHYVPLQNDIFFLVYRLTTNHSFQPIFTAYGLLPTAYFIIL